MATKYQQVLAVITSLEKGKAYPSDVAKVFSEFADEVIEDLGSGIEVKQHAAMQKIKELLKLFNQINDEINPKAAEDVLTPSEQVAIKEMNASIKQKLQEVQVAHDNMVME